MKIPKLQKKKLPVIIGAIALVLLASAVLVAQNRSDNTSNESNEEPTTFESEEKFIPFVSAKASEVVDEITFAIIDQKYTEAIEIADAYVNSGNANNREQAYVLVSKANITGYQLRDLEGAISIYNTSIELAPEDPRTYAEFGKLYQWWSKNEEARVQFEKALQVYDAKPDGYDFSGIEPREHFAELLSGVDTQ